MSVSQESVEEKARALGLNLERGLGKFAGFELKGPDGEVVLGVGHTASLKATDDFLDNHIKTKARALGFRLSAKKSVKSFDEFTSGEARAVQREATTGYKLETIGADGTAVLGDDSSATILEIIAYLNKHQIDVGIDDVDIEVDDKKPKIAPPSLAKMRKALAGHANAEEINRIGYGNKIPDRRPTKAVQNRRQAIEHLLGTTRSLGFDKLPPEVRTAAFQRMGALQREEDEYLRDVNNWPEIKDDLVRLEAQRRQSVFLKKDRELFRTNIRSRHDVDARGQRPGLPDSERIWIERNELPDPDAPDFQAVTASTGFAVKTKKETAKRGTEAKGCSVDALREAAKQRRLANAGPKIRALLKDRDYAGAAIELEKIKADTGHGNFLPWLAQAGIEKQVAQRCMRRQKRHSASL